ncbi:hypothetical protein FRC18_000933 [Serendipita sp. 400]|nr:hypothetical protein FRC18_000933 [Serendipita sp. 400]
MSECDMACTGDASEICGGPDRILICYKSDAPTTTTYTGVIEVHDSASNDFLGTKDTQNGISKYSTVLNNAEMLTFEAPYWIDGGAGRDHGPDLYSSVKRLILRLRAWCYLTDGNQLVLDLRSRVGILGLDH